MERIKEGNTRQRKAASLFILTCVLIQGTSAEELEEITVQAQKRDQLAAQVPISMSVLDSDYLARSNFATLESLSANQPGLDLSRNSSSSKIFMRGVGSQGNAGLEQSVSIYVDEVYHGRSRSIKSALVDIEQIDILKGPQGTFFGLNSSAGAIAIRTRGAELNAQQGFAQAVVGTDGELSGTLAYNLPLSDTFATRLVANLSSADGFWTMVDPNSGEKTGEGGGHDSSLLRVSSLWQPSETFSASFKIEAQDIERDNPYAWQPRGCDDLYGMGLSTQADLDSFWAQTGSRQNSPLAIPFSCQNEFADSVFDDRSPASPFNSSQYDTLEGNLRLEWDLGDYDVIATTGYYQNDFMFQGNDLTHGGPAHRIFWVEDNSDQVSQEVRLSNYTSESFGWMIGAYFHNNEVDYQTGDADGRNQRNLQFIRTQAEQEEDTFSAYAAIDWALTDQWTASAGLRWSRTEKTFSAVDEQIRNNTLAMSDRQAFGRQVLADQVADPAAYASFGRRTRGAFDDESRSYNELMPSVGLQFQPAENTLYYYNWRRGYKAGGFNFRLNGLDDSTLTYDSEEVSAHELGVKTSVLDEKLQLNVAVFVSDYKGLQQNSNRGDDGVISAAVIRNAAAASSDGLELEAIWQINERWQLDVSGVWLDAKFDDYQGADCSRFQSVVSRTDVASQFGATRNGMRCSQDLSGKRLTSAPELTSRIALSHNTKVGNDYGLRTTVEWFYSDEFFTSPHADETRKQDAFSKYNVVVDLFPGDQGWLLSLVGSNLGDELTARQLGQDGDAAVSGLVDDPRRVSLRYQLNF
ncbi:MAG: TonB-dependent receptor [Pseudomonadota bacterium]